MGIVGIRTQDLLINPKKFFRKKAGKTVPQPRSRTRAPPKYIPPSCKTHKNQKLNIYCDDCSELTCTLCKCFGAHLNCRVTVVKDLFQLDKEELVKHLDISKEILKDLRYDSYRMNLKLVINSQEKAILNHGNYKPRLF